MKRELPFDPHNLTRRQVLQRFGALGGSSLVMGTMDAWGMLGAPSGTRPDLSGSPPPSTKVLVLGAGVSGLVTGYELGKRGYDYQILEARDRVGGLNWSVKRGDTHTELGAGGETQRCDFDEGHYINGGPWRLRQRDTGVLGYCKEVGVPLEIFVDETTYMYNENPSIGPLAGKGVNLRDMKLDLWGSTAELLAKALDQNKLDVPLSVDDKGRLVTFLTSAGWLNQPDHLYVVNPAVHIASDRFNLGAILQSGFASQVRSVYSGTGGPDPVLQPVGGMMQFPVGLSRAIGPKRLTLGVEVVSVHQTADNVKVVYKETKNGKMHEVTADYVVSCLPMPIVKKLDINFSPEMKTAVQATMNATIGKMGLQMKRRFWEEDNKIFGGHLAYTPYTPGTPAPAVAAAAAGRGGAAGGGGAGGGAAASAANPLPQFSYPANGFWSKKGVLLGFYGQAGTPNKDGKPLVDLSPKDRIEHVLFHASKVHPQMRAEFENAYCVWWPRVKYNEAAYGSNPGALLPQLSKADGRIYIGCASASSQPSWQEGAVESAWRTVKALHERVMA